MSGSVNKATIVGNLGKDPELIANGKGCRFSVATSETWKDKDTGEKKEKTQWHNVKAWGKLGELCMKYLAKGRKVYVSGAIEYSKSDDGKYFTDIKATEVVFLGSKSDQESGGQYAGNSDDSDVPF